MKVQTILSICILLAMQGCGQVTLENYNKISVGMSYDEVAELIGSPDECDDLMGVRSCLWGDEKRSINVNFVRDKALIFSSRNLQ